MWERASLVVRCILASALAHLAVHLLLSPGSSFLGFPATSDDYAHLSSTELVWSCPAVRPVSQLLIQALSAWGQGPFYLALNLLTVAYVGLVLGFLCLLLRSRPGFLLLAAGAVAALALEGTVERYLYAGSITNLSSGVLGAAALIALWTGIGDGPRSRWSLALGIALSAVALLAKGDQLFPLLAACACGALTEPDPASRRRARIAVALLLLIGLVFAAHSLWLAPEARLGLRGSVHQRVDLQPTALLRTAWRLLTVTPGATFASACLLWAVAVGVFSGDRRRRGQVLLVLAVVLALVLPYAILPERVYAFFAANWAPWQLGLLPALAAALAPAGRRQRRALSALLVAAVVAMLWVSRPGRAERLAEHEARVLRSRTTLALLERLRPALSSERLVAVAGVSYGNPWRANDGRYLANRLGFANDWIVLAREDYIAGLEAYGMPLRNGRITTRPASDLPELGELPVVLLRPDGTGTLCRGAPVNSEQKPRIEVSFAGEPCGSRRARVSWLVDDRVVVIRERSPGERVLARGKGPGSARLAGLAEGAVLVLEREHETGECGCLALTIVSLERPGCR